MSLDDRALAHIHLRPHLLSLCICLLFLVGIAVEGNDFPPLAGLPRGTPVLFGSGAWAPYRELGLTNLVKVDANRSYVVGLRADGTVVRWGSLVDDSFTPSLERIVSVSAGGAHTLALREDGQLLAWVAGGNVFQDQILPIPTGLGAVERIAAGHNHSVVVDTHGRVWAWGAMTHGSYDPPDWATNAVALTAGQLYSGVILPDGQVRGWYPPGWGTAELPPPAHAPAIQVDASIFMHVLSLRSDGRVFGWGYNDYGQATVPAGLDRVVQVAAGGIHSAALRDDGTVVVWGDNSQGQREVPSNYRFFAIAAADYFTVGLTRAPVVTGWPDTVWAKAGDDVELAVDVVASDAYTAYWYQENTLVATGTTSTVILTNIQPALSSAMRLVVSNAFGFAEQPIPLVVEDVAPRILRQPVSIAVLPGGRAIFQVEARGSEPISYQWQFQGVDIPGATDSLLELVGVTPEASGSYRVVVRNGFGEVWSQPRLLSAGPPLILEEPLGLYQFAGWDTRLSVAVLSPEPLSYQWFRDGVELTGQQDPALALEQATPAILGAYHVVAANSFGAATSAVARVRLFQPVATAPPPSLLVAVGANHGGKLNFPRDLTNVSAVAMGDVHGLALRADGQLIGWGGEDGSADWDPAIIPATGSVTAIAAGRFHNLALQQDGTVRGWGSPVGENFGQWFVPEGLSNVVAVSGGHRHSLALRENGTVVQWPMPEAFPAGVSNVIAVAAGSGSSMLLEADGTIWDWTNYNSDKPRRQRFQNPQAIAIAVSDWWRWCLLDDGVVLTWNNSDSPPVPYPGGEDIIAIAAPPVSWGNPNLLRADGRIYSASWGWLSGIEHALRIAGSFDAVAALTRAPYLDEIPVSTLVEAGQTLTLRAAARSSTIFDYQWEKDGVEIPGAMGALLTIPTVTAFDRGEYRVRVQNEDHSIVSPPATVSVAGPVEFEPMDSLIVSAGADVRVSPVWAGEAPVTFVWQRDGVELPPQPGAELFLTNVQAEVAGEYRLMAANPYGTSFSSAFQIEVVPSVPWILTPPVPLALPAGSDAVFQVEARGSEPLEWQWHWNESPIAGATNPVLHLPNVQDPVAGFYAVEVRNALGSALTVPVALTVNASPPVSVGERGLRLVLEGNDVVLDRAFIGSEPMIYQWRCGGLDIEGATWHTLEIPTVSVRDAGLYTLVVANALGQVETPPLDYKSCRSWGMAWSWVGATIPCAARQRTLWRWTAGRRSRWRWIGPGQSPRIGRSRSPRYSRPTISRVWCESPPVPNRHWRCWRTVPLRAGASRDPRSRRFRRTLFRWSTLPSALPSGWPWMPTVE
jgi:alpha-tubulin suppressor-like RCC1 family protein